MLSGMSAVRWPVVGVCVGPCVVLALGGIAGCAPGVTEAAEPGATPAVAAASPTGGGRWARVLRDLDRRRERAFVRADPSMLGRVYLRRSQVLRADARLLRAYRRRGLELDSARLRLRSVTPEHRSGRRLTLRVVDRLARVRVRAGEGPWRTLPRDRPTERIVTLRRTGQGWRIAGVRRVAG